MRCLRILALLTALSPLGACVTMQTGGTGGSAAAFTTEEDFRQWFTFYYQTPQPERLRGALDYMDQQGYLVEHAEVASIFLAGVFSHAPEQVGAWIDDWAAARPLSQNEWDVILVSVWFSKVPGSDTLLDRHMSHADGPFRQRLVEIRRDNLVPPDLTETDVRSPTQINLFWAAFSATGDERLVHKIVSYIHLYGDEDNPDAGAVGEAALMSLANNIGRHAVVADACRAEDRQNPDAKTRSLLDTMFRVLADEAKKSGREPAH